VTRYRWVAAREAENFPIAKACEVAGVSRQSFYDWKHKTTTGPSMRETEEARLVEMIRKIHDRDDTVAPRG
jgi:putative transposase